jgi:hypothetical protein
MKRVMIVGALALLASCDGSPKTAGDLESRIVKLEADNTALDRRLFLAELELNAPTEAASLTLGEDVYAVSRNRMGFFPMTYEEANPKLDGYDVVLNVGNPTSANLIGAKFRVQYGPPLEKDPAGESTPEQHAKYQKARKTKTVDINTSFLPGRYTRASIPIFPAKAEEIREISVQVFFDRLAMPK